MVHVSARKKKTVVHRRKSNIYDPQARIGKRNADGTINMCRINDYGDVSIIPVHVFKSQGVAYGPGYRGRSNQQEIIQYKLDSLFLTKEEALAKSDRIYRAYERDHYDYIVKPVYLRLYRGGIVRADHASKYGRNNLSGLFTTEAAALETLIPELLEEVTKERQQLKEKEASLKQLQKQLVGAKKRQKSERGQKYSDVRQYVYDEEETRKRPKVKETDDAE